MKPVKWGILSTANIGMAKVIPGMLKSKELEVAGIASRDLKRAKAAAKTLGIAKAYGSYEEMIEDPEIEAIYNPLPNHLHVRLTLAAARAGKHVLCEKPMSITTKGALALRNIPAGVHVAEAFMVRHALQWIDAKARVKKGEIGEVRAIQVMFSYFNTDPKNVRNMADIGGGGMLDIGCYPITISAVRPQSTTIPNSKPTGWPEQFWNSAKAAI
jgi:predicted dehydrogenase